MFGMELLHDIDQNLISDIVKIDRDSFPEGWEHSEAKEYFSELLKNVRNIRIILKVNGRSMGYL
ncbi:MAG: hypothetical protein KGI24_09435, partial [Candidatus Omnitrophica bacterium]|nr:hypothetical protein [Candidatus Omnitrophota bacterium]